MTTYFTHDLPATDVSGHGAEVAHSWDLRVRMERQAAGSRRLHRELGEDRPLLVLDLRSGDVSATVKWLEVRRRASEADLTIRRATLARRATGMLERLPSWCDPLPVPVIDIDLAIGQGGLVAKICALDALRNDGLISDTAYERKRAELLRA